MEFHPNDEPDTAESTDYFVVRADDGRRVGGFTIAGNATEETIDAIIARVSAPRDTSRPSITGITEEVLRREVFARFDPYHDSSGRHISERSG